MTRSSHTLRHLLGGIALCAAGGVVAQSPLTEAQTRHMGAHVFERQVEVFRRYCAADTQAAQALEASITRFRTGNPDFVTALDARPAEPEFVAGVEAFDARFAEIAEAMHGYLSTEPPQARCAAIARQLGDMRFAAMIDEATRSAADAVTAAVP